MFADNTLGMKLLIDGGQQDLHAKDEDSMRSRTS
jgi:hypothetical protein